MDRKTKIWLKLMKLGAKLGCHQRPERSFFMKGYQFPVCARCTGILIGYVGAIILYKYVEMRYWIYGVLILPMVIDGGTQYIGWRESIQPLRFITGIFGGYGLLTVQIMLLTKLFN